MGKSNDVDPGQHKKNHNVKIRRMKSAEHHERQTERRSLVGENMDDVLLVHNINYSYLTKGYGRDTPNVPNIHIYPEEFIKHQENKFQSWIYNIHNIIPHSKYAHMSAIDTMRDKQTDPFYVNHYYNGEGQRLKMSRYILASIKQLERRGEMRAFGGWRRQQRGVFDCDSSLDLWKRRRDLTIGNDYDDGWYGW